MHDPIANLLDRGTVDVIVKNDLRQKLQSGKKLRIKLGIDPSGADLHIGHMVVVRKLREFQALGHHILLLFGNFTGQIGDPSGKMEARKAKTQDELEKNAKKYLSQVKSILDIEKIEVCWNADWLSELSFADVVRLASNFTVAQMLERDMYQNRMKHNLPIVMHEFFYPLMQGYDSVALKADVELGGTDQTFNLLAGRTLQKAYGQTPQDIVTVPILEGLDGVKKMGKSEGNYIAVDDAPREMYGKTMSIPDALMVKYFELATNTEMTEISKITQSLTDGENPRNVKARLAREIVSIYHSETSAKTAEEEFNRMFREKGTPDDMPEVSLQKGAHNLIDLLVSHYLASSRGEAKRLIAGGGVKVDQQKIEEGNETFNVEKNCVIQAGKRKFLKIAVR